MSWHPALWRGGVGAKAADLAPESIPADLSEKNDDLMAACSARRRAALGVSDDLLRTRSWRARRVQLRGASRAR